MQGLRRFEGCKGEGRPQGDSGREDTRGVKGGRRLRKLGPGGVQEKAGDLRAAREKETHSV